MKAGGAVGPVGGTQAGHGGPTHDGTGICDSAGGNGDSEWDCMAIVKVHKAPTTDFGNVENGGKDGDVVGGNKGNGGSSSSGR